MNDLNDLLGTEVGIDVDNLLGANNEAETSQEESSGQQADESENPSIYTLVLERPNFSKLTSALSIIQDICVDCDIRWGKIQSKSNDRKNVICIDLTSVLGRRDLSFSQLKMKLSLLKTFDLDMSNNQDSANNSVIIEATQNDFKFSDALSGLTMRKPIESYLENIYMDSSDFHQNIELCCREDSLLFNYSVDNYLKNRISQICNIFRCDAIVFEFNGDTCTLATETKSKDNISKVSKEIVLNSTVSNKKCSLNSIPFVLNIQSGLTISCYKVGESACMFKSDLTYYGIPVTIYSKARLQDSE